MCRRLVFLVFLTFLARRYRMPVHVGDHQRPKDRMDVAAPFYLSYHDRRRHSSTTIMVGLYHGWLRAFSLHKNI